LRDVFGLEMVELPVKTKKIAPGQKKTVQETKSSSSSKSYVVRNILPAHVYKAAIENDIIEWGDDVPQIGLVMVLLSLIYTNGRVIPQDRFKRFLIQLELLSNSLPSVANDMDELLKPFIRVGYIEKQKAEAGSTKEDFEYRWGPRAKVEIEEKAVRAFIIQMYGESAIDGFEKEIEKAAGGDDA